MKIALLSLLLIASPAFANCPADLDGSGEVGFADLLEILSAWGTCDGCPQDLDGSGEVGFSDLLTVLSAWGPCPRECLLGETVVLFDNIGRAAPGAGFGPFNADPLPSSGTDAHPNFTHATLEGIQQTLSVSVFRPENTVRLESVEMVLAQSNPNDTSDIDVSDPSNWPEQTPNFAVHVFSSLSEFAAGPRSPDVGRICFGLPDPVEYPVDLEAPFSTRLHLGLKNFLLGWNVDERVSDLPGPLNPPAGNCVMDDVILEAGKEYLIGVYSYIDVIEKGAVGVVSSAREENDLQDAKYVYLWSPNVAMVAASDGFGHHKLAYMARGVVVDCCDDPADCPCLYPPDPRDPEYQQWLDACTVGPFP